MANIKITTRNELPPMVELWRRLSSAIARAEAAEERVGFLEDMIRIAARRNEVIPEEVLLVSNREPTEAEREYGRSLIGVDAADEE